MSISDIIKEELKKLRDAGGIYDLLGLGQEEISKAIEDGEYAVCKNCNRVFYANRLINEECELCINDIPVKKLMEIIKDNFEK